MTAFLGCGLVMEQLPAQSRVLHVWVDPHYGNDAAALAWDPGPALNPANSCSPLDTHPHNVEQQPQSGVPLLHAPGPFRTVTAAVSYLNAIHPGGLPHTNTRTGIATEYAIIHCLPGRYARSTAADPHTGLQGNGETFPIRLPQRVSVQGTSALNTVFDAANVNGDLGIGPIFEFGHAGNGTFVPGPNDPPHPRQFLDSLSLTGAIDARPFPAYPAERAAVYVRRDFVAVFQISNCFLYCNGVGVLVDAGVTSVANPQMDATGQPPTNHHVVLVNNTFAWNVCGIWNGQISVPNNPTQANPSIGLSVLSLVNNLFDATPPLDFLAQVVEVPLAANPQRVLPSSWLRWKSGITNNNLLPWSGGQMMTSFEGVDIQDVQVLVPNLPGQSPAFLPTNFNAWESNKANRSSSFLGPPGVGLQSLEMQFLGLHMTRERTARLAVPGPLPLDIGPITGRATQKRGILFVRDLLHEGGRPGRPFDTADPLFDVALGDFRLAPGVADQNGSMGASGPPTRVNPLVEMGYAGPVPLAMANGVSGLVFNPIDLGAYQLTFDHSPWDWDCEGYGNPRIFDHPAYPVPATVGLAEQDVDIGADEVDRNVIAGYRYATTMFVAKQTTLGIANDYLWYLCPAEGLTITTVAPLTVGQATAAVPPMHSSWPALTGWTPNPPAGYYTPLYVDVTPHLLPDIHPFHTAFPHPFTSNLFWQSCSPFGSWQNPFLYQDPTVGIINPLGSFPVTNPATTFNWLDVDHPSSPGNPIPWMSPSSPSCGVSSQAMTNLTSATGDWCYFTPATPNSWVQPSTHCWLQGGADTLRASVEYPFSAEPFTGGSAGSNLQTFMVWVDVQQP